MRPAGPGLVLTALLAALVVAPAQLRPGWAAPASGQVVISVPGIPGPYCMYGLEKRFAEMPEVAGVQLLWEEEQIRVALKAGASVTRQAIEEAIEQAEYPYDYSVEL